MPRSGTVFADTGGHLPRGTYRIDNSRIAPNHVFAQPLVLLELAERTEPPPPYFQYATDPARTTARAAGSPAVAVTIDYGGTSTATWRYHEQTARWRRSEAWTDHMLESGEQVAADSCCGPPVSLVSLRPVRT